MQQSIHIHCMVTLPDGTQQYCYPDYTKGSQFFWTVYRRIEAPEDAQQPFDIKDERDFDHKADAIQYAYDLRGLYGLNDLES